MKLRKLFKQAIQTIKQARPTRKNNDTNHEKTIQTFKKQYKPLTQNDKNI